MIIGAEGVLHNVVHTVRERTVVFDTPALAVGGCARLARAGQEWLPNHLQSLGQPLQLRRRQGSTDAARGRSPERGRASGFPLCAVADEHGSHFL